MSHPRRLALAAGILHLITHVTSVGAAIVFAGAVEVDGAINAPAVRVGVLLEFLLALGCLGTDTVLLPLLRPHGAALAYSFAGMRIMEAAVIAAATLPALALLHVRSSDSVVMLQSMHSAGFLVGQGLIISFNTLVLGALLLRARLVPRALAILGLAGGALVLVGNLGQLFGLNTTADPVTALFAVPIFAFEIWFAVHLITNGLRTERDAFEH